MIDPIYHIQDAKNFARAATQKYLDEHPGEWYPCGFAWVNIKPARGPLVKMLKALQIGSTDSYNGGYTVWNPSDNPTQSMEAKAAGARAFAKVLVDAGFNATIGTRID